MIIEQRKATQLVICCISAIVAVCMFGTGAKAAMLTNIEGTILVNQGNGFKPVVEAALLNPGDRIHADNGAAFVVYENNCSEKVGPHQTVLVLAEPPVCSLKDGAVASDVSEPAVLPGDAIAAGSLLAFGGGVAAALANSGGDVSPSVSP